ncbi:MAG: DUF4339 domain-containing protein [Gemmataceae bacterium]
MATDLAGVWYYTNNRRKHGPVSFNEIQSLVRNGTLNPTDLIWQEGMPDWVQVQACQELIGDQHGGDVSSQGALGHSENDDLPGLAGISGRPLPSGRRNKRKPPLRNDLDDDKKDTPLRPRPIPGLTDDDPEETDQPRRRRRRRKPRPKSSSTVMVIAGAVGLFVLFLIIGLAITAIARSGKDVTLHGKRSWNLRQGEAKSFPIRFNKDHVVDISVTSKGQSDVDLFVFDGKKLIVADEGWGQHCELNFIPDRTKTYKVVVINRVWLGHEFNASRNASNSGTLEYTQTPQKVMRARMAEEAKREKATKEKEASQPKKKTPEKEPKVKNAEKQPTTRQTVKVLTVSQAIQDRLEAAKHKTYPVRLLAGVPYTIDMTSSQFHSRVILYDAQSRRLQFDDQKGGGNNARIQYVPAKTGLFQIVTDAKDDLPGNFQLKVSRTTTLSMNRATTGSLAKHEEQTFAVSLTGGRTYTFDLISSAFDAHLTLRNRNLQEIVADDDGGTGTNSRIVFRPVQSGRYLLTAKALFHRTGTFQIVASEKRTTKKAAVEDIEQRLRFFGTKATATGTISSRTKATFIVKLYKSRNYTVDVMALTPKFDPSVRVRTSTNRSVGFDNNSGGKLNARLTFEARKTDDYEVEVRGHGPTPTGRFQVVIQES